MRVISNPYVADWESRPQDIRPFGEQALISVRENVMKGLSGVLERFDTERDCMAAGQSAGAIHDILPAADIVANMVSEAEETIRRLSSIAAGSYVPSARQGSRVQT